MRLVLDSNNYHPATVADIRASGSVALLTNATEGTTYVSSTLATQRQVARGAHVPFGSYLFLHPDAAGSEAAYYLEHARPQRGDVQPIIDAEVTNLGTAALALRVQKCALALEAKGYSPILYASSSVWQNLILAQPKLKRLRVWEAQYPSHATRWLPQFAKLRIRLRHGVNVVLWQWTDAYKVNGKTFDCSVLLAPLNSLLIGGSK